MTADEKIERMEFILENILPDYEMEIKQDAINFLKENKGCANLNLRTLIMVSKVRLFDPVNWQNLSKYMLNS